MLKDHNSAFRAGGIWLCWESPLILWSVSIHISGFLLAEKGGGAHTTVGCYLLVCHFLQLFSASDIDFQCHFDLISPVSEQSLTVDASQHPEISISPDFGKIHWNFFLKISNITSSKAPLASIGSLVMQLLRNSSSLLQQGIIFLPD